MVNHTRHISPRYGILQWLLLAVIAAACATAEPAGGESGAGSRGDNGSTVALRFTICTADGEGSHPSLRSAAAGTRATGVWEEDAADVAERILSADDMRVHIFDQSGVLLTTAIPSAADYTLTPGDNDGYYSLTVAFNHDYFDKFPDDATVPFTVMILANLRSIGAGYADYSPGATRLSDVADSFVMDSGYYPTADGGIPMYGLRSFTVAKNQLTQGIDAPIAGQIDMLRALCRIDVADRVVNATLHPDGLSYPRVVSVEMTRWNDHGYIRPRYDDYAQGLRYANIYPASPATTAVAARRIQEGDHGGDDGGHGDATIYRFYCPEAEADEMHFSVGAILAPGEGIRQFRVSLSDFQSRIGSQLIRNHIYRFDIHAFDTRLDLTATVADWRLQTDEYRLDDIVSMEPGGLLQWEYDTADFAVSTETYNGNPEQQLSLLNGTTRAATGRFHILSPTGARWRATLIPGENGVDAFEFVDLDDRGRVIEASARPYAEGTVGTPAQIHIRGKGAADAYRHWAELVIEVLTPDGTVLYAPLTAGMSSKFIIYRENRL